jgi:hypothetical protein
MQDKWKRNEKGKCKNEMRACNGNLRIDEMPKYMKTFTKGVFVLKIAQEQMSEVAYEKIKHYIIAHGQYSNQ